MAGRTGFRDVVALSSKPVFHSQSPKLDKHIANTLDLWRVAEVRVPKEDYPYAVNMPICMRSEAESSLQF